MVFIVIAIILILVLIIPIAIILTCILPVHRILAFSAAGTVHMLVILTIVVLIGLQHARSGDHRGWQGHSD